jgi:hypothetical protein
MAIPSRHMRCVTASRRRRTSCVGCRVSGVASTGAAHLQQAGRKPWPRMRRSACGNDWPLEDWRADFGLTKSIRQVRVGSSRSVPAGPSRPSAAPRDIGQLTPYCPKPGSEGLLTESHHRMRAAAKTAHKPSLFPRRARVGKGHEFLVMRLKPAPMLGFRRESGFGSEGRIRRMSVHLKLAQKVSLFG